jgi:DNA-binding transcriptional ArsR family regulator
MEEEDTVRSLLALGHPMRLRAFRALVVVGQSGMTPGTMSEGLGLTPSALSFHLKELMNAGLVTQQRDGRNLVYRAAFDRMNALLSYLTENCCQGEACGVSSSASCCSPS